MEYDSLCYPNIISYSIIIFQLSYFVMTIIHSMDICNVLYHDKGMTMGILPIEIVPILTANRIFGKNRGVFAVEKWDPRVASGEP